MQHKKIIKPDFVIIPYQLYQITELQSLDRDVYGIVYWFEHLKDGECRASNETIAQLVCAEPRSVQNSLNRLEQAGAIARVYKDATKRNRLRIITKISYKNVRTTEDTKPAYEPQSINVRKAEYTASEPQSTRESNSKRVIEDIPTAQGAEGTGRLINELLEGFKLVNPSYSRLYKIKAQREALERLIKQHGAEKIRSTIAFLPKSNSARHAPTITTPYVLEMRLGDLLAWAQKQRDTGKGKQLII